MRSFTLLRPAAPGVELRKIYRPDGMQMVRASCSAFRHEQVAFRDVGDLYRIVTDLLNDNAVLVRGAPCEGAPAIIRRNKTTLRDESRSLLVIDVDKITIRTLPPWWEVQDFAEELAARLPSPFSETSFVMGFTASNGLEMDGKRWTGNITAENARVRLFFVTERAISSGEAKALMAFAQTPGIGLDDCTCEPTQLVFLARPVCLPDGVDPLARHIAAGVPMTFLRRGEIDELPVPEGLKEEVRWARAEGRSAAVASHPSAIAAVRAVGRPRFQNGRPEIRAHLTSAIYHLVRGSPEAAPEDINARLIEMVEAEQPTIETNLAHGGRTWSEVVNYLFSGNMLAYAEWLVERRRADSCRGADGGGFQKQVQRIPFAPSPEPGLITVSLDEAEKIARATTRDFLVSASTYWCASPGLGGIVAPSPPRRMLAVEPGVGKTRAALEAIRLLQPRFQQLQHPQILYSVPNHRLSGELLERARCHGIRARDLAGPQPARPPNARVPDVPSARRRGHGRGGRVAGNRGAVQDVPASSGLWLLPATRGNGRGRPRVHSARGAEDRRTGAVGARGAVHRRRHQ